MAVLRVPTTLSESSDRIDDLNRADRRRRTVIWIGGLVAVLVVTLPVGVGIGPVAISPSTVTKIFSHHLFG